MRFFSFALALSIFSVFLPLNAVAVVGEESAYTMEHDPADLRVLFEDVQRALSSDNYAEAGNLLGNLKEHAEMLGYKNLPEYSWKLIERAELLASSGKQTEAGFLVRRAVELSPADARVRLTASSFFETLGKPDAIDYLRDGFTMLPDQPSSAVPVMLNVLIVGLVAFTLAFFMTCLVQVIVNSAAILKRFNRRLPVKARGLLGPLMLAVLLGVPIFGGLLVVIGCWALILSRCVRSCRWLGISAGSLALAWWFCIPVLQTGGGQAREPMNRTLENVRNQSYGEYDETIVMTGLQTRNVDPLVAFSLGLQYLRSGKTDLAAKVFAKLQTLQGVSRAEIFRQAALVNLGVIEYRRSNLDDAMRYFTAAESQGADSYELYHNMAVVYLAQVDTVKHREYYEKARSRADGLDVAADESSVLSVNVPLSEYYYRFLKPISNRTPEQAASDEVAQQQLFESLMYGGSQYVLFIWAAVLILLGAANFRSFGASRYLLADGAECPSLVWALVPGGYFGAGRHPGTCVVVLGIFMMVVMLALGEPNIHYEVVAGELPLQEILFFVAAGIVVLQGGLSVLVAALSNAARRSAIRARA